MPACGPADDVALESNEEVATSQQAIGPFALIGYAIQAAQTAKQLYDGVQWVNCAGSGFCPKTETQAAAESVIFNIESTVQGIANDGLIGRLQAVLDRSVRDFGDLTALGQMGSFGEEAELVNEAESLFDAYVQRLSSIDPANQASVDAAYALAPSFLICAAFLDQLARIELVRNEAPMTIEMVNEYRRRTLHTLDLLVGTPNLWYECPGNNLPQTVTSIHSFDAQFAKRKLWKLFADYRFGVDSWNNDCNVFRRVAGAQNSICQHDCSNDFPICKAGIKARDSAVYPGEVWKIVDKMKRDPIVRAVRDTMEQVVSLTATQSAGLLWRLPTGYLRSWNFLSNTSFEQRQLGNDDPAIWATVGSGDFNRDGTGDVLWLNKENGQVRISMVGSQGVTSVTPPAAGDRFGGTPFVGDLDGDGDADIVWTGTMSRPFQGNVYLNDTWLMDPGSAAPVAAWRSQGDQIQGIGNFDNDFSRTADVLYRGPETGNVSIQFGLGGVWGIGWAPLDWQIKGVGDFNADGYADILWYNVNSGDVAAWGIQGTSIIANVWMGASPPSDGYQIQAVADLDHDGVSDIIWRHTNGHIALWHMAPTWQARDNWHSFAVDNSIAFGGVIEMGPPLPNNAPINTIDISQCGDPTGEYRNPGFAAAKYWRTPGLTSSRGVLAGDVNGDGTTDLVGLETNSVVASLTSNGQAQPNFTMRSSAFFGTRGTLLADVTGDKKADLIALGSSDVRVSTSTGGAFSNPTTWRFASFTGARFAADVTGDGKADLVAINDFDIKVIRSTGSTFSTTVETWFTGGFFATHGTLIGDVSGDGKADLVRLQDNSIEVAVSSGSGFSSGTWFSGGFWGSKTTLLGDVTGDGKADLVALDNDAIRVMRVVGDSFGGSPTPYFRNYYPGTFWGNRGSFLGDIDNNGKADLIIATDGDLLAVQSQ